MLKVFFILIVFANITLNSQNKWEIVEDNFYGYSKGTSDRVKVIQTLDSNNCFVVTDNGRVFYSTNQGQSWKIILNEKFLNNSSMLLEDAEFIDTNTFFLVNYKGFIYKTRDGGKTFDSIDVSDGTEIYWLKMFNENEGIANAAMWNQENPKLGFFYTKNSWKTWDTIEYWVNNFKYEELWGIGKVQINNSNELISLFSGYSYEKEAGTVYYGKIDLSNFTFNTIFEHKRRIGNNLFINGKNYFSIGKTMTISGGSGNDFIYKFDNNSKQGRPVIEFYYNYKPWGFQDIAFKNDSVGIAVGQFGKICYTYDAGESWYYETEFPSEILGSPSSMLVEYAGDYPIIANNSGIGKTFLIKLIEDNLAPKPQDKLVISGYVKEDDKPQAEIPVELDNRYTMTDSNGYYQFIHIRPGKEYNLRVYNKYYSYTPYTYSPETLKISTTKDTTINFQATDKRIFHNVSGNVNLGSEGLPKIPILTIKEIAYHERVYDTVKTNLDGFYHFDNIEDGFIYTFRPLSNEYTFEPSEYSFSTNGDRTGYLFTASPISSIIENPNFKINNNILISKDITGLEYKIITLNGNIIETGNLPKELNLNQSTNGTYILNITKNDKVVYTYKYQVVK
jgi:hypothetical protein